MQGLGAGSWARRLAVVAALASAVAGPLGCSKKESILAVGDGKHLSAADIDADPLALLPGGALGMVQLDVSALVASSLGPAALRVAGSVVPLTPAMNFDPSRDLKTLVGGFYSTQSLDAAFVAQGAFDPAAIRKAADSGALTALGKPLQKVSYANNDLYLSGDVGFVLLTARTLLAGNPAGMRRALDRLRDGRVKREVPDWVLALFKTPGAALAAEGDLNGQAMPTVVAQQVPFLQGVQTLRVLGDFEAPGVKLAGSFTYPDAAKAKDGEGQIKQLGQLSALMSLLAPFGVSSPLRALNTHVEASEVQFIATLDGPTLAALLEKAPGLAASFGAHAP